MILKQVEVRNYKKLSEQLILRDIPTGLAVLVGENEEGKSTLLQAIRSCFFDKHNMTGDRARSLQPYNSAVRPEVAVNFELHGHDYRLKKAFCQQPHAELITPKGRLEGSAAEEELARLLRFTPPQRTRKDSSDHDHEGVFGMFWVEQGRSFMGVNPTSGGRNSIQQALQQEVGDVLGGRRAEAIKKAVEKRRSELLTTAGKPRGMYAEAFESVRKIEDEKSGVNTAILEYESKLGQLERWSQQQKRYRSDSSLEKAEERVVRAREVSLRVSKLKSSADQTHAELEKEEAQNALAISRLEQRTQLEKEVQAASAQVEQLQANLETRRNSFTLVAERRQEADKVYAEKKQQLESAVADLAVANAAIELALQKNELDSLSEQYRKALEAKELATKALNAANEITIDKNVLARLKKLEDAVIRAKTELNALATKIRIELQPGTRATIAGNEAPSGSEHRFSTMSVIEITNHAHITVIPGGEIGNPIVDFDGAQQKLTSALREIGASSITDASARFEERADLLNQAQNAEKIGEAHAPDGIEELQAQVSQVKGEVKRLEDLIGGKSKSTKDAEEFRDTCRQNHEKCKREYEAAELRARGIAQEFSLENLEEAAANAKYEAASGRLPEIQHRLSEERAQSSDSDLQEAVSIGAERLTVAISKAAADAQKLLEADPEAVDIELKIALEALDQIRKSIADVAGKVIGLQSELRTTGAQGLGERLQVLEAELESAQQILSSLERQAKAIDLLHSVLSQTEKSAKESYLAPISQRIQPYLKLLLPGTEVRLNEEMEIIGLRRGSLEENFDSLSLGTREQLAVLTRLAFADLLRDKGQPAPVLLDDAIVYADDERFNRMLRILRKASEKTQILVFTCRERDYETSGAPLIRLADCRVRSAASAI